MEAAAGIDQPRGYMCWLHEFVRPVLRYEMVVCGTGLFTTSQVFADRLLVRGFPCAVLDRCRDESGIVGLPRGRRGRRDTLGRIHPADSSALADSSRERVGETSLLVSLEAIEASGHFGSYFLFGGLMRPPEPWQTEVLDLLRATMHATLVRTLESTKALRPGPTAGIRLTRRETELLSRLVEGLTTPQIAALACRSEHTIANQIRSTLAKLNARNRTEAIARAMSLGLVKPREKPLATRLMAAQDVPVYALEPVAPRVAFAHFSGVFCIHAAIVRRCLGSRRRRGPRAVYRGLGISRKIRRLVRESPRASTRE